VKINVITLNYAYCKIVQLTLRYEYSTTQIFHKTEVKYIRNYCLNKLFQFFKILGRITTNNFVQINIITPNYAYYKIFRLKLRYEHSMMLILHKT
jgi:hypothetical protein